MADQVDESSAGKLRLISAELGLLSRPDGSANLYQGDTGIVAAVYGPGDVKMNRELIDQATVDFVYKPKSGMPGCAEKFQEHVLRNTCHSIILASLHPRTSINVIVQELQNSGGLLACCINASCLALLDSGIPLKYMMAAVNCIVDKNGEIILDPTAKEIKDATVEITVAFDSIELKVISLTTRGQVSNQKLQECISLCQEASKKIINFFRDSLQQKLARAV